MVCYLSNEKLLFVHFYQRFPQTLKNLYTAKSLFDVMEQVSQKHSVQLDSLEMPFLAGDASALFVALEQNQCEYRLCHQHLSLQLYALVCLNRVSIYHYTLPGFE